MKHLPADAAVWRESKPKERSLREKFGDRVMSIGEFVAAAASSDRVK